MISGCLIVPYLASQFPYPGWPILCSKFPVWNTWGGFCLSEWTPADIMSKLHLGLSLALPHHTHAFPPVPCTSLWWKECSHIEVWVSHPGLYVIWLEFLFMRVACLYGLFIMHCTSALTIKRRMHYPNVKYVHCEDRDKCLSPPLHSPQLVLLGR